MKPPWEVDLSDAEREVIEKGDWNTSLDEAYESGEIGDNPAVVVVDVQQLMLGPDAPVENACEEYRTACGETAWDAVDEIAELLSTARANDVPIYYFKAGAGRFDSEARRIAEQIQPTEDDEVIEKPEPSGFFGTDFAVRLNRDDIDTLVVTGGSTCGCVRATVDDANMEGYGVIVPPECVFDRVDVSHRASLLDISMKRGEVASRGTTEEYLSRSA